MFNTLTKDGYTRTVYGDSVHWIPESQIRPRRVNYCIVRFPFVPDYHLCDLLAEDYNPKAWQQGHVSERPLQQFKTLTQALAVLRVIEGSQP